MFFKNHKNFYLLPFFIILIACQFQEPLKTHGIIYLENRSQKVIVNKSNKNDIIRIFGQPQATSQNEEDTWIYFERILTKGKYHKLGRHVVKENNVLVLEFNKFGIIKNKKLYTKEDINKIAFLEKKTENKLSQKSFVESFLQSVRQKMYKNR
tara:strand:+ start:488 stop:946 length:459 start_codon:yes stop_codon:yes gene_type:complete